MTYRQHIKENLTLAIPVMLSNLGHVLMGITDNIMVGHVNATSLAAAGLATVVFNVLLLFGIGVSYAITPLVAKASGEKNPMMITNVVRHGLIINVLNSIFLIGIIYVGKNLLYHIDQSEEVISLSMPFLSIITFSLLPAMVFQTFKQFTEGLSMTKVALIIMIGANVVNIILNYAFVYGHFGFEPMGLTGSGWATFCSRIFMAIAIALYVFYHRELRLYRKVFSLGNYSRKMFSTLLHLGVPSGVQFIFEVAAFDFSLVMMGWLGPFTQAAHQIAINLATLSYMTTAGLAAAATVRVGYFSGQKDFDNVRKASYSLLSMASALMCLWAVLFMTARFELPMLYVENTEVVTIAASLLVIAGLFQLSDGVQVVCVSALRGLQDVKIPSLFILAAYWAIGLPLGYLLAFKLNMKGEGIWWGLFIGLTITAIAMFLRLQKFLRATRNQIQVAILESGKTI